MAKNQNKTQLTEASVDDFLNTVKDDQKRKDAFEIKALMETLFFFIRHLGYEGIILNHIHNRPQKEDSLYPEITSEIPQTKNLFTLTFV